MTLRKATVLIALALLVSAAHSEDFRRDGNWWREQSEVRRSVYTVGLIDGMDLGSHLASWGVLDKNGQLDLPESFKIQKSFNEMAKRYLKNVTNDQLADGLTAFYEDYRNRSILITDASWVVLNSIAGKPRNELETMTENLRKNGK